MKKVRVAVIGCGVIGPTHVECYKTIKNVEITWLCDLDVSKASKTAEKFGITPRVTANAAEVFAAPDVDAVSICTDRKSTRLNSSHT